MILARVLLILALQLLMGVGIVRWLKYPARPIQTLALGMLAGLPLSTFGVLAIDSLGIPLTLGSILLTLALLTLLANVNALRRPRDLIAAIKPRRYAVQLSEVPFLIVLFLVTAISIERCWHLPIVMRDMIVGPDLVAKYAVEQGTLVSSVFTDAHLRDHLSNQPFYAPFTMLMQVVFRFSGHPFGQAWLSALLIAFLVFLYSKLRDALHPVLAGILCVLFVATPELFAHTFVLTVDFSNAIFFALAVLLLDESLRLGRSRTLILSALFMGFACWSRSETIMFVPLGGIIAAVSGWRHGRRRALGRAMLFVGIPLIISGLWHIGYLNYRLPQAPEINIRWQIDSARELLDLGASVGRLLGYTAIYGYLAYVFAALAGANIIFWRDRSASSMLLWLPGLYLGLVLLVALVPAAAVETTVKRGLLKLFPIMVLYLGRARILRLLSERIARWELGSSSGSDRARDPTGVPPA